MFTILWDNMFVSFVEKIHVYMFKYMIFKRKLRDFYLRYFCRHAVRIVNNSKTNGIFNKIINLKMLMKMCAIILVKIRHQKRHSTEALFNSCLFLGK